jgi:hypothetical protein
MIANGCLAAYHSRILRPFSSKLRVAGQISLIAALPVGNEPHVFKGIKIASEEREGIENRGSHNFREVNWCCRRDSNSVKSAHKSPENKGS